jgi:hypothetical protein
VSSFDSITKRLRGLPRGGRLLSPQLGLVFLGYPIRVMLESDPTPMRVLLTLGGAALFAGVFLWLMLMHEPLPSRVVEPSEIRKRRAAIASLAGLVVALNLILGNEWRVLFFHVNIAAGFMLLRKDAYAAIAGLAVVTFILGITSGLAFFALPRAAIGLWATAFVRQVAAVAETSEQLRRAEEDRAREAQELSAARVIQQQLLPKELPTLPGWRLAAYYRPARAIGGDFYDFLELPDGQVALVAGDVTDKGITASRTLRSSFESLRTKIGDLMSITVTHHSQPVLKMHESSRSRRKTQMPGHENLYPPDLPFGRSVSTRFPCTKVSADRGGSRQARERKDRRWAG